MTQDAISAEPVEEGGRETKTVVLAGLLAAAVLGAGAYVFLGGSSADEDEFFEAAPTITRTVADTEPDPLPPPAEIPAPATVVGGQNPFSVLYTAPVESASGSDSGSGSGSSNSGSGSSDSGSGGSDSDGAATIGSTSGSEGITLPVAPAVVATEPYVLELVSITPADGETVRTTSWIVDGTPVSSIFVGQRFGTFGELVVLALGTDDKGETVLLQVGDAAPRVIHIGEQGSVL